MICMKGLVHSETRWLKDPPETQVRRINPDGPRVAVKRLQILRATVHLPEKPWTVFTSAKELALANYGYDIISHISIYIYWYTVKMKVRMPPKIPNIPPPQLECGTRTAKNHSVRMPHHPGFKFFVVFGKPFAQIPHLECLHTMNIIRC
jgi:hypothetical protein